MRTLMRTWVLGSALLALGCAAGGAQSETFAVRVRALDDLGMPLANLQLSLAGASLGATDAKGEHVFQVPGKEGQRVDLGATCPEAYTGPRERPTLLLLIETDSITPSGLAMKVARWEKPSAASTPQPCVSSRVRSPISGNASLPSPCSVQALWQFTESTDAPSTTAPASAN